MQLEVVWSLSPQTDSEGPSFISRTAQLSVGITSSSQLSWHTHLFLRICCYQRKGGAISQLILPMIPLGAPEISGLVTVWRDEETWTYFAGVLPIYSHKPDDLRMFRLVTSQLIETGTCQQVDVIKTFGVSRSSVARSLGKLREGGPEAFFKDAPRRKSGTVLTEEVLKRAQEMLDQGCSRT